MHGAPNATFPARGATEPSPSPSQRQAPILPQPFWKGSLTKEERPHPPPKTILPSSEELKRRTGALAFTIAIMPVPNCAAHPGCCCGNWRSQRLMMSDIQSPPLPPIIFKQAAKFRPWLQLSRGEMGAHYYWPPLPHLEQGREPLPHIYTSTDLGFNRLGPQGHIHTQQHTCTDVCADKHSVFSI